MWADLNEPSDAAQAQTGLLVINCIAWAYVYVGGVATGRVTPIRELRVSAGRHVIGLKTDDGVMHDFEVDAPRGERIAVMRNLRSTSSP